MIEPKIIVECSVHCIVTEKINHFPGEWVKDGTYKSTTQQERINSNEGKKKKKEEGDLQSNIEEYKEASALE